MFTIQWCNLFLTTLMLYGPSCLLGVLKASKNCKTVQNDSRIILQRESSRNTFDILNWVDLSTRRQIHKCVLVFKCLNNYNLVPKYLSGYFVRNSNIHSYNTRMKDDLHLPKPNLIVCTRDLLYTRVTAL